MIALAALAGALVFLMALTALVVIGFASAAGIPTPPMPERPSGEDDEIEWRDGTDD